MTHYKSQSQAMPLQNMAPKSQNIFTCRIYLSLKNDNNESEMRFLRAILFNSNILGPISVSNNTLYPCPVLSIIRQYFPEKFE